MTTSKPTNDIDDTQSEEVATPAVPARRSAKRQKRFVLSIISVALIIAAVIRLGDYFKVTQLPPELPHPDVVVTEDTKSPSEVKADTSTYTVPADQPRRILIEKLSVDGLIQKVGLNPDNAISVPSNIWYAGWFTESSKPGEKGLSVIDGHVSGRYSEAIFKHIGTLQAGDVVKVEYGDLSQKSFEVVDVKSLPVAEAAKYLLEHREGIDAQLNLITCGGAFDGETEQYAERVVVVTKKIDS